MSNKISLLVGGMATAGKLAQKIILAGGGFPQRAKVYYRESPI